MHNIEVEIKSLLGSKEAAIELRKHLLLLDPSTELRSTQKLLNHYFQGGNLEALAQSVMHRCLSEEKCIQFEDIAKKAKSYSVRTRLKDDSVFLVVKMSLDDVSSDHSHTRIEFEEKVNIPLEALDALILGSGFIYQAKWSKEREEYAFRGITVCIDNNAGYGWVAEFEKMVREESEVASVQAELRALMKECALEELSQDRLGRMFQYYNEHWKEYYGTNKVFTVA